MTSPADLSIRPAGDGDAAAMAAIYAPVVNDTAISFETIAPSAEELAERVRAIVRSHPWLVAELAGRVVGYAYATPHRTRSAYQWSVEVSAYVAADARRKGVGRALYGTLFEDLWRRGYVNAYAGITLPNPASVGLHESLGFEPVGVYRGVGYKLGAWRDVGWWALALGPRPHPPAAVRQDER